MRVVFHGLTLRTVYRSGALCPRSAHDSGAYVIMSLGYLNDSQIEAWLSLIRMRIVYLHYPAKIGTALSTSSWCPSGDVFICSPNRNPQVPILFTGKHLEFLTFTFNVSNSYLRVVVFWLLVFIVGAANKLKRILYVVVVQR